MFLVLPLGYFVAVFLLVTGIFNCVDFMTILPEGAQRSEVLNGLCLAGWPILAAVVVLLLIQVCRQLEHLRLAAGYSPSAGAETGRKNKKKKAQQHEEEQPENHPVAQPDLAHLVTPATPAPQPRRYPNSPIPGGGRVPQPAAVPQTRVMKQAPKLPPTPQPDSQGLNYFKVE